MPEDRTTGLTTIAAFLVASGILAGAGAFALEGRWPWRSTPIAPATVADLFIVRTTDTLQRGETLSELFARQGMSGFVLSPGSTVRLFDPARLRAGLVFTFERQRNQVVPSRVVVRTSLDQRVALVPVADGWAAVAEPVQWTTTPVTVQGRITTSLWDALDTMDGDSLLPAEDRIRLAWDLADIFAWQVDFSRDIRPGDSFRVLAERLTSEEGEVRYGRVLAGDLVIGGNSYSGFRFTGADGVTGYYDAAGRSLRRAFLLAPVAFRRISSRINRARLHPVLGFVRRHEGIDFAADPGTPVMAAGDGVVIRRDWIGGFGNLVELRHANGIITRYGHLQGFAKGISTGDRVRQGEVIGYVGSTGLATGPHLHYEFRVNGVSRDPRSADLGTGEPIPVAMATDFAAERSRLSALLSIGGSVFAESVSDPTVRPGRGASF